MIKDKRFVRNFIWNMLGSGLASFNSLFFMMAITRINGLEAAGVFSITFATASIFYTFALYSGRGCHTTDIERKIKDKDYIVSRMITCILTFIGILVFAQVLDYNNDKKIILVLLSLWRIIEAFCDVLYGVMQKNGELHKVGISLLVKGILGLFFFILVDSITKNLIYSCTVLVLISISVMVCYDIRQAKKYIKKEEKATAHNIKAIYRLRIFYFC